MSRRSALMRPVMVQAGFAYTYSGTSSESIVTFGGKQYLQIMLTKTGVLTVLGPGSAQVWLAGGGSSGCAIKALIPTEYGNGGGGGDVESADVGLVSGTIAVTIGAGGNSTSGNTGAQNSGSATKFGDIVASGASGADGASGGGAGYNRSSAGTGAGVSTYPFKDTTNFSGRAHSPGGGGSGALSVVGGRGGSNGSSGSKHTTTGASAASAGGAYGGGNGPAYNGSGVTSGSFYGAGGGGGNHNSASTGAGYQGVVYIRVPIEEVAS